MPTFGGHPGAVAYLFRSRFSPHLMKTLFTALSLACLALPAAAQTPAVPQFNVTCDERGRSRNNGDEQRFCEIRDLTMPAPAGQPLSIAGGANGGITVHGWSGPDVRIRAKVTSWARTEAEAQAQVQRVTIGTANNQLRAEAPGNDDRYSVSYEVFVPRQTALVLNTVNGGIDLDNVLADVQFRAVNGGVSLAGLGGQVTGKTVNGGLSITLTGGAWDGRGLDVKTTNGGISWKLPKGYSAQFFTSTDMGSIRTDLPVTKTGLMNKEVVASLGKGGAPVKAVTTNGGIRVVQN